MVKVPLQTTQTQLKPNECVKLSLPISRALSIRPSSVRDTPSNSPLETTTTNSNSLTTLPTCPRSGSPSIMPVCQRSEQQMRELFKATRNKKLCNQEGQAAPKAPPRQSELPRVSPQSMDMEPTTAKAATISAPHSKSSVSYHFPTRRPAQPPFWRVRFFFQWAFLDTFSSPIKFSRSLLTLDTRKNPLIFSQRQCFIFIAHSSQERSGNAENY